MSSAVERSHLFLSNSIRARNDGNKLLSSGDVPGAVSAYKQSAACVTVAVQSGADKSSPPIIAAGVAANSNLSLALLRVGNAAGALDAANEALLFDASHEKSLWRRAAALRDLFRKKVTEGGDGEDGKISGTKAAGNTSELLLAVQVLLATHPENAEGVALLAAIETGEGAQLNLPLACAGSIAPTPKLPTNSSGEGGALRGLSAAKTKAGFSGLYADTPGYDEPMRDIRPLPELGSRDWWADLCCCSRKRKVE